jgi:hypothetical protein
VRRSFPVRLRICAGGWLDCKHGLDLLRRCEDHEQDGKSDCAEQLVGEAVQGVEHQHGHGQYGEYPFDDGKDVVGVPAVTFPLVAVAGCATVLTKAMAKQRSTNQANSPERSVLLFRILPRVVFQAQQSHRT